MTPLPFMRLLALASVSALALPAQDWSDEELVNQSGGFQSEALTNIIEQVGRLVAAEPNARTPMIARIHGDHREYRLKVDRLLEELCDPNWQVREHAERTLIEIGGRAMTMIQQRRDKYDVLEQHIRCKRIIDRLNAKGTEQEDRERALLQGLVRSALYFKGDERLLRSLRSALGHTDSSVAGGALRALGKHGTDNEANSVANMVTFKNGLYRQTALGALARMKSDKAIAHCRTLLLGEAKEGPLAGVTLNRTEACAIIRTLHGREDAGSKQLLADAKAHKDPVIAHAAATSVPEPKNQVAATLTIPPRTQVKGAIVAMHGESFEVADAFTNVPVAELSFSDCNTIDFPEHAVQPAKATRIFLNQGSRVQGIVQSIDPESVKLQSALFGELVLKRADIQGIAFDPELDRLVGASPEHDRVRLRSGDFLDGKIVNLANGKATVELKGGERKELAEKDIAGMLFTRPRSSDPDPTSYVRLDLTSGERLIGFVADLSSEHVAVSVPLVGAAVVPWTNVHHGELGVRGGAMWGFTLIADYSDNRIVEVDDQGRVLLVLEEIFGAWDAECLDNGNLLITEFSVSRVQEVNRQGETLWSYEELKNPYDADRLQNGNTLIADTFASRVIEIDKEGNLVWSYDKEIRPFDCDRLANGNTLIADVLKDRVIEVSPKGEIVWEGKNLPNAHDADRLPNGNTLVTLRNQGSVLEIDRDGKVVFELSELSSPSDADRLPNGNTIVAENTRVRVFDRHGNEVWSKEMTWAVEVNRY